MQPNVRATGLLTHGKGELVPVGFQVTELVQASCRRVRNHRSLMPVAQAVRGHLFGLQPEPCRAEFQVFHTRCAPQHIDAVGQPRQHPIVDEPGQLDSGYTCFSSLSGREQPPLALSQRCEHSFKLSATHTAIVSSG